MPNGSARMRAPYDLLREANPSPAKMNFGSVADFIFHRPALRREPVSSSPQCGNVFKGGETMDDDDFRAYTAAASPVRCPSRIGRSVAESIDRQPVSRFPDSTAATCSAVLFLDGFDTQAIG